MSEITPNQRTQLVELSMAVFQKLDISEAEAIGRVMVASRRNWRDAIKGLDILRRENLVPAGAIDEPTVGLLARYRDAPPMNPGDAENTSMHTKIAALLDRFDCVPIRSVCLPWRKPLMFSRIEMSKKLFGDLLDSDGGF